jgi:hypothetical protein
VTRRQKLGNACERLVLQGMMLSLALVLEKALDRMVSGQGRPRSALGQRIFRRFTHGGVVSSDASLASRQ